MYNVHLFTRAEVLSLTPAIIYSHSQNKITRTDQILARNGAKNRVVTKQQISIKKTQFNGVSHIRQQIYF